MSKKFHIAKSFSKKFREVEKSYSENAAYVYKVGMSKIILTM